MLSELSSIYTLTGQGVQNKCPAAIRMSLQDIFAMLTNPDNAATDKLHRWFFSQSLRDVRPKVDTMSYATWSGITVIDLDVKNANAAAAMKAKLAKLLNKQAWFVGIVLSSSHRGLHIYTCCKPDVANMSADVYLDHMEAMSIIVWQALLLSYRMLAAEKVLTDTDLLDAHPIFNQSSRLKHNDKLSESNMFDTATFRFTQPTIIGYDPEPLLNDNFHQEPPLALSSKAYDNIADIEPLKVKFDKFRGRFAININQTVEVGEVALPTIEQCMPRSYDNTARYRLAYTLANLYDIVGPVSPNYGLIKGCFLRMCSGNPKYSKEKHAFAAVFDSATQRQASGMCPRIAWAVNELKTVHHFDIEVKNEAEVQQQILDVDIDLELSKPVVLPPELNIAYDAIYALEEQQYIADATDILLQGLQRANDKTLLIAEPGTGKTVFATNLMQHTDMRVLCIVPYISVIESKFKTLPPKADCQCCYGFASYDVTASRNAVMTFDKFSRMSVTDLDMCFDIIILDESHLLQMSSYRSVVPAECIDRLRATHTPTVLMTGTPIAEHMFVTFTNKVLFKRKRATEKLFSLVVCNNPQQKYAQACLHICNALKAGRKVIMPTNEGNSYVEKVVATVQNYLARPMHFQYYKKEYANEAFMYEVNRNQTLGDIELLFCSAYLSVGVDINDFDKFDIVYTEDFTAHEIEQFNNRLRRVDLASYYFIAKYANDGYVRPNCMNTISPNLRVSRLRQLELHDLLALQTLQVDDEGKVSQLFDYFVKHLRMPWLIRQPDGTVKLHATCYALWTFEDTWRKWSYQVPILVDQLRKYNYQIEVINAELLDDSALAELIEAGRNGLRDYKDRICNDIAFICEQMQNKDFYDVMVYSNAMRLQRKQYQGIEPYEDHIDVYVQNVAQCYRFIRSVRMLSKYYTRTTVMNLYAQMHDSLAKFEQVCQTVELLDYASNDRLSTANVDAIRYILYVMFDNKRDAMISRKQYAVHIAKLADIYRAAYDLQASTIIDKVTMHADNIIRRLAVKQTQFRGDTIPQHWQLKTIPAFDSSAQLNLEAQKAIIYSMFKASMFETNTEQRTSTAVASFFTKASQRDSDYVQLAESMQRLQTLRVTPTLTSADKLQLKNYMLTLVPSMNLATIATVLKRIDVTADRSLYLQAYDILQELHIV